MMTITLAVPADATSETLLGYLKAIKGWEYVLSYGADGYWATTYYRTDGPFKGYKIDVPQHDEDPSWLADAAAVINGVENGRMPVCGLSPTAMAKAVETIRGVCREDRTGMADLSEVVALLGVADAWYGASDESRAVIHGISSGRHFPMSQRDRLVLDGFARHLTELATVPDELDRHPASLCGEVRPEPWLECCKYQHYDDPGTAYVHTRCGRLLQPFGDVHDHRLCTCYGKSVRTAKPAQGGILAVAEIT